MGYMVILAWALLWAPVYSDSTSDPAVYPLRVVDHFFSMLFRRCQGDVCGKEPFLAEARTEYGNGTPTPVPDGAGSTTSVGDNDAGPTDGGSSEEESAPSSPASAQEEAEEDEEEEDDGKSTSQDVRRTTFKESSEEDKIATDSDQPRQLMSNKEELMAAVKDLWDRGYRVDKPYSIVNCPSWIGYKCSTEDEIKAGWSSYADDASEIVNDCRHTCRVPGYKTPPKWHDPNEWDFFNFGMR